MLHIIIMTVIFISFIVISLIGSVTFNKRKRGKSYLINTLAYGFIIAYLPIFIIATGGIDKKGVYVIDKSEPLTVIESYSEQPKYLIVTQRDNELRYVYMLETPEGNVLKSTSGLEGKFYIIETEDSHRVDICKNKFGLKKYNIYIPKGSLKYADSLTLISN
jgi:hypothetical protein